MSERVTWAFRMTPWNCAEFLRSQLGSWTQEAPVRASSGETWELMPEAVKELLEGRVPPEHWWFWG